MYDGNVEKKSKIQGDVNGCSLCQKVTWYGKHKKKYARYDFEYLQVLQNGWGHSHNVKAEYSVFSEHENISIEYGLKDYMQNSNWQEENLAKRIETFKNIWGNTIWGQITIITLIREGVFTEIPYNELRKFVFRNKPKRYHEPLVCTDCIAKFINEKNEEIKDYLKYRNSPEGRRKHRESGIIGACILIIIICVLLYIIL